MARSDALASLPGRTFPNRFYAGDDLPLSGISLTDIHDFDEHLAEDMKDSDYGD